DQRVRHHIFYPQRQRCRRVRTAVWPASRILRRHFTETLNCKAVMMNIRKISQQAPRACCKWALCAGFLYMAAFVGAVAGNAQAPQPGAEPPSSATAPAQAPAPATDSRWPQATETAPAPTSSASPTLDPALLPRDLSPWGMFMSADNLVKAV